MQTCNLYMSPPPMCMSFSVDDLSLGDYGHHARDTRDDLTLCDDATRELRGFRDNMNRMHGILGDLVRFRLILCVQVVVTTVYLTWRVYGPGSLFSTRQSPFEHVAEVIRSLGVTSIRSTRTMLDTSFKPSS